MTTHFLAECLATPWALQPERMAAYAAFLARRYYGEHDAPALSVAAGPPAARRQRAVGGPARSGSIAVVPVYGTIMQRSSQINICDGGTSTEAIAKGISDANADESISAILLDVDSPGGSVYGVAELAAQIRASAKPVYGIANSLAASAGYWVLSQCAEVYVTPGGEVGSIGVWQAHQDLSKALSDAGVAVSLISAGKYKVEGNPYGPLGSDAKAFIQSRVDDYYGAFTRDVAKGRKTSTEAVRGRMGEGRVLGAEAAKAAGMVDGVMTMDQLVRHIQLREQAAGQSARRALARAQLRRLA